MVMCGRVTKREKQINGRTASGRGQEAGLGMGRSLEAERVSEWTRGYAECKGEGERVWQASHPELRRQREQ